MLEEARNVNGARVYLAFGGDLVGAYVKNQESNLKMKLAPPIKFFWLSTWTGAQP
jgi:hypothetical protein